MSYINSSKITWTIYEGSKYDDSVQESYCADGDGLLSVQKHKLGVYIVLRQEGQFEGAYSSLEEALEVAQACLEEDMPEVFAEAMHWEDESTTEESRLAMNAINGYRDLA